MKITYLGRLNKINALVDLTIYQSRILRYYNFSSIFEIDSLKY